MILYLNHALMESMHLKFYQILLNEIYFFLLYRNYLYFFIFSIFMTIKITIIYLILIIYRNKYKDFNLG